MKKTKIEWATVSWNPLLGCSKVSEGCRNCYAERMMNRLSKIPALSSIPYASVLAENGHWNNTGIMVNDRITYPKHLKRGGQIIFVCSMSDLFFHADNQIRMIHTVMASCPQHTFLLLTKRPDEMLQFYNANFDYQSVPNIWKGITVENQDFIGRIERLQQLPDTTHNYFLSVEPMLSFVNIEKYLTGPKAIKWVICGAESGPEKVIRQLNIDWVRNLRDQCVKHKVPFMFKQKIGYNGKKISLPELDGRVWNEFPKFQTNE